MGVAAGLDGVEVDPGSVSGAAAEPVVEMGAAKAVATHGPRTATGGVAVALIGVSGH